MRCSTNADASLPFLKKPLPELKNTFFYIFVISIRCFAFAGIEDIDFTPDIELYNKVCVAPKNKLLVIRCNVCGKWKNIAVKSIGETSDHILLMYHTKKSQKIIRGAFFFYYVKDTIDIRKSVVIRPHKKNAKQHTTNLNKYHIDSK